MNAPFNSIASRSRNSFNAYIGDDITLDVVRQVAVEMGWQPEKCQKSDMRSAIQSLSVAASPNILLIDLSGSDEPMDDVNALAEVCEPGTMVIAMGKLNDVHLYRDLIASGVQDYLVKPISAEHLRGAIAHAQAVLHAPILPQNENEQQHSSAAVIGTRGGVGASLIATSLAWYFSAESGRNTALLDLDVHFGTGALTMDLEPGRGLTDAIDNPGRIDGLFIERAMIKANEQLSILSAEAALNAPLANDGAAFFQLQEEFQQVFEMTVTDVPRAMMIDYPQLMRDIDVAVLVVELTLASARDTIRILSWLKSNAPDTRIILAANKVQAAHLEITKSDFEASIERKIDYTILADFKATAHAAKLGQPFVQAHEKHKNTAIIHNIAEDILGAVDSKNEAEPANQSDQSLAARLFDFRKLLSKNSAQK